MVLAIDNTAPIPMWWAEMCSFIIIIIIIIMKFISDKSP